MNTHTLSGYDIYDYIISGARRIIHNEKTLNTINVFPIADSDTGSNLTYTMKCIIAKSIRSEHIGTTLSSISKVASEDSFGNSGTIFASYLTGLAQEANDKSEMTPIEFAAAANTATLYAYDAVARPEEGTMLTVMRVWSDYLITNAGDTTDLKHLFSSAFKQAQIALENTRNQLRVLKESNVVDAGALGFVYFLEGILEFIDKKATEFFKEKSYGNVNLELSHNKPNYRYCCEFLVESAQTASTKSAKNIYQLALERFDHDMDSLIVQNTGDFMKIHCHMNTPDTIADFLAQHGKIVKSKIDDMQVQHSIAHNKKHSIGIVTDTIADIPESWLQDYQVTRIPLHLLVDGNAYVDRYTVTSNNLYTLLDHAVKYPTSGQPGDLYVEKTLETLLTHYDHVLGIFVSSEMSGLFDKVDRAAHKLNQNLGQKKLHIFDSKANSASQGLIIHDAIQLIQKNYSIEEIVNKLTLDLNKYHIHVEIPDLHYATQSGRVPKILGGIAGMFGLKVVISINEDGKGIVCKERSLDKIVKQIRKSRTLENYVIVHSQNPESAQAYADMLEDITGIAPLFINEVSSVVAAFVGKGSVGIGYKDV